MGSKEFRWLVLGFAAATLLAAVAGPRPASAQTAAADASNVEPAPAPAQAPAAPLRRTVEDDEPLADPGDDSPSEEDDERPRRPGERAAVIDGDLSYPPEPEGVVDGEAAAAEPEGPVDGADPVNIDMREEEDRGLFENPPAGFDPLLFQIEDLDPILDRRPERLFRLEPYDPVGIKVGSFVYFPEVEISGDYFSNVFSSPVAEDDVALALRTNSRLVSTWSVHALELRAASDTSFHSEFDTEDDRNWLLEARGRLDITGRTNIQAAALRERSLESRQAIDATALGDRTPVDTTRGDAAFQHRFNRLTAQLRTSVADLDYGEIADGLGGTLTNDDRDTRVHAEAVRLAYELKPSFAVFAEGGLEQRAYRVASLSDGLRRDSDGQRYRFGLDFGSEGAVLRGELSFGYGLQDPDETALDEAEGFLFDSNVTWRVTELTALRLTGRTDFLDTQRVGVGQVLTREVGLEARHAFRRYFIGTAGVSFLENDYAGSDLVENEVTVTLDAEYFASREVILFGHYEHTAFMSSEPDSDYDTDEVRVGVRLRR